MNRFRGELNPVGLLLGLLVIIAVISLIISVPRYIQQKNVLHDNARAAYMDEQSERDALIAEQQAQADIGRDSAESGDDENAGENEGSGEAVPASDHPGHISVILSEPHEQTVARTEQRLNAYGYKGSIGISNEYFPGEKDMLPVSKVKTYAENGWEITMVGNEYTDFPKLYQDIRDYEFPAPQSVYYRGETLSKETADEFTDLGITNVVMRISDDSELPQYEGLTIVRAYGSNEDGAKDLLTSSASGGTDVCYTVGSINSYEKYSDSNITAMFKKFNEFVQAGSMQFVTPSEF